MSGPATLIISDIHTRYQVINQQIRHAERNHGVCVARVFVLGDFGFFRQEMNDWFQRSGNRFERPVFCIEGNHEDFAELESLVSRFAGNLTYLSRGSVLELGSMRGLCLGGARYMDAASTPRGCEITPRQIEAAMSHDPAGVDLVLTHDCPAHIGVPQAAGLEHYGPTGVPEFTALAERYRPRWWFFGHHHRWFDTEVDGTRFLGLPRCWQGYVLLPEDGLPLVVENLVGDAGSPWWKKLF